MGKYNFKLSLDDNNSLKIIIDRIKNESTVLEFGPAEGRLTKYLSEEMKCNVTVIELDKKAYVSARSYAVDGLCSDIESFQWVDYLKGKKFDYIIFADVLEHLREPEEVLARTKEFLEEDGSVIFSIPNIAHNKVLAKLYCNHMDYTETGLLDNTHIKFWGYENLTGFCERVGYQSVFEEITYDDLWSGDQAIDKNTLNEDFLASLDNRQLGNAYQFIFELKKEEYCKKNMIKKQKGRFLTRDKLLPVNIYYDYGKGYREENKVCICANCKQGSQIYSIVIPIEKEVKQIRFDPVEDSYTFVQILSCVDEEEHSCELRAINGFSYHNIDVFNTKDPQYVCDVTNKREIHITYIITRVSTSVINQVQNFLMAVQELELAKQDLGKKNERIALLEQATKLRNELIATINEQKKTEREIIRELEVPVSVETEENYYKEKYEQIENSNFWKMTKPVRCGTDKLKVLYRYCANVISEKNKSIEKVKPRIAVHLHLYYEDLLEEFCNYFNNITEPFDLYISCKKDAAIRSIKKMAESIKNVQNIVIKETPNRGRDIAPFYVLFREELCQYECLLHVHSKKSLYTGEEKAEWRHWALDGVLKSEESVAHMLYLLLEADNKAGLIYGELTPMLPILAYHWLKNAAKGRELLTRLNIKFENGMFNYPVGSFFWARTEAIKPLFDLKLTYEDFDEEQGQIDGTLAHALERVVAFVSRNQGYDSYIFDAERKQFSKNIGYRGYEGYFGYNVNNVSALLSQFDLISFDIFDTLITRMVYEPDDVFRLMSRIVEIKYHKNDEFIDLRKKAEEIAWGRKGDFCNIHDIYDALLEITDFTKEDIQKLKQLEIDLEYQLCIPRKEAREVFDNLIKCGKKIVLVSDMYLTKPIIERMLKKCGYQGYEDVWVSCELGLRKDRDTMWEKFFEEFKEFKTIHVGDNAHSDCQLVGDRQKINMLWLSGIEEFKISPYYDEFKKFLNTSVENSVMLGYLINACLFNSPFAVKGNGRVIINQLKDIAQGVFAPVFLVFAQFISNQEVNQLLFLSREGYFLQKLYKAYCDNFNVSEISNQYFLTSRRAVSVPQIESAQDISELLDRSYNGSVEDLLKERFGIIDPYLTERINSNISLPEEKAKGLEAIALNAERLISEVNLEREAYKAYVNSVTEGIADDKIALVDVGYAGSIQCYLMKLMKKNYRGCYLATEYNLKPEVLGGVCSSVYTFSKNRIFEYTQLFLEAVTAAPHGQVIRMEQRGDEFIPVLKDEKETCWETADQMQKDILRYLEVMGKIFSDITPTFSSELSETILSLILKEGILGSEFEDVFTVYDGYCTGNGEWKFDTNKGEWKLE